MSMDYLKGVSRRRLRAAYDREWGISPSVYVFAVLAAQQAADVLTTKAALSTGGAHEANPSAAPYVHLPVLLLLVLKVGLAGCAYLAWRWAEERHIRRTGKRPALTTYLPLLCTIGLYAYILTNNVAVYLATRT